MSTFSTASTSSYSSSIQRPHTPSPSSPIYGDNELSLDSSPSSFTPPDSLRKYSTALKAMMTQGMSAAMADLRDDSRIHERQFDIEFGYDDEDPIDRHMKSALTSKVKKGGVGMEQVAQPVMIPEKDMLVQVNNLDRRESIEKPQAFRPGLIHFHRSHSSVSRGSLPSFSRPDSAENSGEGALTPTFSFDIELGNGSGSAGTPGSMMSEASFEAIKPEDYEVLYGNQHRDPNYNPFFQPRNRAQSPLHEPFKHDTDLTDRSSLFSTDSTITSASTETVTFNIAQVARPVRPGMSLRQRSSNRSQPYPASVEMRSRERSTSGGDAGGILKPLAGNLTPKDEGEDAWLNGRSTSEMMVAKAGLRSQRTRAAIIRTAAR